MVTDIDIPEVEAAITDQKLFERAFLDAVGAFAEMTMRGRSLSEAVTVLELWRENFERGV